MELPVKFLGAGLHQADAGTLRRPLNVSRGQPSAPGPAEASPGADLHQSADAGTVRRALIVSHGQPSAPAPAEAALAEFAARIAAGLPSGWRVASATLAAPDALEAALARFGAGTGPLLIYPMFIADGWFTQVNLPARLRAAGIELEAPAGSPGAGAAGGAKTNPVQEAAALREAAAGSAKIQADRRRSHEEMPAADLAGSPAPAVGARILPPFGLDPGILPLALEVLDRALSEQGQRAAETRLIVAAHGSFKSPAPAAVARRLARNIIAVRPFAEIRTAFIDQAPRIADFARDLPAPALCLPFFAASGGHVEEDLPKALAVAGFVGRSLPPLGLAPGVPELVAAALMTAARGA